MAEISAKMVNDLRAKTGAGLMDCKRALTGTNGDFDEAIKVLREKGLAVAAKKADRIAAEGVVDILYCEEYKTAAMIEVNSESDFVAKNADFLAFVRGCLDVIMDKRPADVAALLALPFGESGMTVDAMLKEKILTIGENLNIRRFVLAEGPMSTYIHGKGAIGVVVKFNADAACEGNPGFAEVAKNVALQIAAMSPTYLDRRSVPQSTVDSEMEILTAQIKNDEANASKPANIIEKMTVGRMNKFYENNCLLDQVYVKDDSMTVGKYVESKAKEFGGAMAVDSYYRFEKGEGIEKREDNFAEEIAKLTGK